MHLYCIWMHLILHLNAFNVALKIFNIALKTALTSNTANNKTKHSKIHYTVKQNTNKVLFNLEDPGSKLGYPKSRFRDPKSRIRDPKSRTGIRNPGSGIRNPGSGIRNPGSGIWNPGSGIQNRILALVHLPWDPRRGIRNPAASCDFRTPSNSTGQYHYRLGASV